MKKATIFLTLLLFTSFAIAQGVSESFETWPPSGWTLDPADGSGAWVQDDGTDHGPGEVYDGDYAAMFNNYDYTSGTQGSMTTPAFDVSGFGNPKLSFYWWNDDGSYNPATLDIYSSTNGTDFDLIETLETYASVDWLLYETDLASDVTHIKLTATSDYGLKNTFVDDFSVFDFVMPGTDCLNPIVVDEFPFEDLAQTTCGMQDSYSETCMGSYDGGEDIIYEITLSGLSLLNITMDPGETNYTGMTLFDGCPSSDNCIMSAENGFGGGPLSFSGLALDEGSYYLMIDTWPSPDCVPEFDLLIENVTPEGCPYTIDLYDSWGDGWNGGSLDVLVNGDLVLNDITIDDGSGPVTYTFFAETDDIVDFEYTAGSYSYENSYEVYDPFGELVLEAGNESGSIVADCGDCEYSVELLDSFGDGWNGGTLDVIVDGETVLDAITLDDGFGPEAFYFTVYTESVVEFDYTSGSYSSENSYYVYDANGVEVFASGASGTPVDGEIIGDCAAETGTLDGVITDDMSGAPVEGAVVTAFDGTTEYTAETNENGEYEMVLVTGEYDVTANAPGFEPSEPLDVIIVIEPDVTVTQNFSLVPMLGATCSNPIMIDEIPYEDLGQSNCGLGNVFDETCLGSYDGGDDILYTFEITETMALNITMDPKGTTYAGMAVFDDCPSVGNCIIEETNGSSSDPMTFNALLLMPGTYYLMIDTWPAPDCIPDFDLFIELAVPGYFEGVVTDFDTELPIEGVEVVAEPGGFNAFTNADGEYLLEAYEGVYDVSFLIPEYYELTVSDTAIVAGETTIVDAALEIIPLPECVEAVYPAEDQENVVPNNLTFEWDPQGDIPVDGYKFSLYDFTWNEWVVQNLDLGTATTYTTDLMWSHFYGWQIQPTNVAGSNDNCLPFYFNTSNKGIIDGMVTDAETGDPLEGVGINVIQVSPNPGTAWTATTGPDGSWMLDETDGLEEGTYDIYFDKYGYEVKEVSGFEVQPNAPTMMATALDPVTPFSLPFTETWDDANAQMWGAYVENWQIYTLNGNPAPAVRFHWSPRIQGAYEEVLNSYYLDGTRDDVIYAQFDLFLDYYDMSTVESMSFVVYDGTEWHVIDTWDNTGGENIPWDTYTYDISEFASGNVFLIGFMAEGTDTFSFDDWYIDNILVSNAIIDADPDVISDVQFLSGTVDNTFNVINTGNSTLSWEIDVPGMPLWASADVTAGELDPGESQPVVVTMDADVAGAGEHMGEIMISAMEGLLQKTVDLEFKVYEQNGQQIMIPDAGQWGYISSYIDLDVGKMTLEEAMADIMDEMTIMVGTQGIFWPAYNINTIGSYDTYEGYKIKMNDWGSLAFLGEMVEDQTVTFPAGTYIIPILTWLPIDVQEFLGDKPVEFAFGMDGSIYWPDGPIYTLETFMPGYGYLVKFNAETTLDFSIEPPKDIQPNNPPRFENITDWNDVYSTGDFHMLGVAPEATKDLQPGDIIGVFNLDGRCNGMINYNGDGEAIALPVFADDMTTPATDGMAELEPLIIKIFRDGEVIEVNPVYSTQMPNYDGLFAVNGLSKIVSFKEGATSIGDEAISGITVYPNPSEGVFNIDGISSAFEMQVTNSHGQVIATEDLTDDFTLDISDQPTGVYFIRLVSETGVKLIKVVKQ